MQTETLSTTEIEQLAHKRAAARLGWYVHASVYLMVNLGLYGLALVEGRHLAATPALAWGLGLMVHGIVVTMTAGPGAGLYQRMLQHERSRLQPLRDPW